MLNLEINGGLVVHKIDLFPDKINLRRFVLMQIVLVMFVILFTYKWAYKITHIIEQNILLNLVYGFAGFVILLIVHEFIHHILFILFSKGEKPQLKYKKGTMILQYTESCFNRWQFSIIMLAPLIIISSILLVLISTYAYSSLIFMFSIHVGYCVFDILLVSLALASKFKYIQKYDEGLYLYQHKPNEMHHE
ncbi:permease [Staphylococcus pasteuri]|nr:permease [Staphylococcus pasteuri]